MTPTLLTIGHSNHPIDVFLGLLRRHAVEALADVRSSPASRYVPHFNRAALEGAVAAAGVRYLFLGADLGGRPIDDSYYDDEGYVLYDRVAASPAFLRGVARLEAGVRRLRVAVMCGEENPAWCHRHLLVGRVLAARGVAVVHVRKDGRTESYEDVCRAFPVQGSLFDDPGVAAWKSSRPVRQPGG